MPSAEVDSHREEIRKFLKPHKNTLERARRLYFDKPSFALGEKHEVEFSIKSEVATYFELPFRSVVFTGSAQLGFSPHKDTAFSPGNSDLDVACIDSGLFQRCWEYVLTTTYAFNDASKFVDSSHSEKLSSQLLRRGMILLNYLPKGAMRNDALSFQDKLSVAHRATFKSVSIAVYVNEYSFCWKQGSALHQIVGGHDAK